MYMCLYTFWRMIRKQLEKAMAPHSSTLAWKIPRMKEPGRLQSMGSWRVRHDWATSLSLFPFMHQRKKWQPTSVFLPGESQGQRSLVGCHLWGCTESDTTEATEQQQGNNSLSWKLMNKENESNIYPALPLWAIPLGNKRVDYYKGNLTNKWK